MSNPVDSAPKVMMAGEPRHPPPVADSPTPKQLKQLKIMSLRTELTPRQWHTLETTLKNSGLRKAQFTRVAVLYCARELRQGRLKLDDLLPLENT